MGASQRRMKTFLSEISQSERELLDRAGRWEQHATLSSLTAPVLQEISRGQGIDFATALLYDRVRNSPQHSPFIRQAEVGQQNFPECLAPRITVVPGAFYREHPYTGSDGQRIFEMAAQLGWPADRIDVDSFGPLATNARTIIDCLIANPGKPRIFVSLSKGGADLKFALSQPDASQAMAGVISWVNLSGLVSGTPLVAWLRARKLRCLGLRLLMWLRGQRFSVIDELHHGVESALYDWPPMPSGLRVIHVIGFPLRRHLTNAWARRAYERLSPLGPNDGGGILLGDIARLPGVVYPVWGADHYLQPAWDIRPLLLNIILLVAASSLQAAH